MEFTDMYLGSIINVDENFNTDRIVKVAIADGTGGSTRPVDAVLSSPNYHYEGDGFKFVPRVGALCIVAMIKGYDHPVVIGYIDPLKSDGTVGQPSDDADLPGDVSFNGLSKNFIKLHSGGAVTIESTPICSTAYLPSKNMISHMCEIHDLQVSGVGSCTYENFDNMQSARFKHTLFRKIGDNSPVYSNVIGDNGGGLLGAAVAAASAAVLGGTGVSDEASGNIICKIQFGDGKSGKSLGSIAKNAAAALGIGDVPVNTKFKITVNTDGTMNLHWPDSGTGFEWDEAKEELKADVKGKMKFYISKTTDITSADDLTIICGSLLQGKNVTVNAKSVTLKAGIKNGALLGTQYMLLGENTKDFIDMFVSEYVSHQHPTAVGISGVAVTSPKFMIQAKLKMLKLLSKNHMND